MYTVWFEWYIHALIPSFFLPSFLLPPGFNVTNQVDVEDRLYREAARLNITCITLSQRLALAEFHTQELQLGQTDNDNGWTIRDLEESTAEP